MAVIQSAALSWPLALDPQGRLDLCADINAAWGQRLMALISTRPGERVMRTDYGCDLLEALFAPVNALSPEAAIRTAVAKWLPRLQIESVTTEAEGSTVTVNVTYRCPDGSVQEIAQAFQSTDSLRY